MTEVTVVTTFSVTPEHQQELADAVVAFAREVVSQHAGFLSATVLAAADQQHVYNIVRWRRREDFEAYSAAPKAGPSASTIMRLSMPVLQLCTVVETVVAPASSAQKVR